MSAATFRAAVFGVTRSGKDHGISRAVGALRSAGLPFAHLPGMPTVRGLSLPMLGKEFALATMGERGRLMDAFRENIADRDAYPLLIQDEHFCFPATYGGRPLSNGYTSAKLPFAAGRGDEGRDYEIVFQEGWADGWDAVFYLRPRPETVLARIGSSEGDKRNDAIDLDDVRLWMDFEAQCVEGVCARRGIPFEAVGGDEGAWMAIAERVGGMLRAETEE